MRWLLAEYQKMRWLYLPRSSIDEVPFCRKVSNDLCIVSHFCLFSFEDENLQICWEKPKSPFQLLVTSCYLGTTRSFVSYNASKTILVVPDPLLALVHPITWLFPPFYTTTSPFYLDQRIHLENQTHLTWRVRIGILC